MVVISQTTYSKIFFNENFSILIKVSLKFIRKYPIDNKPTFIQLMVWHRIGEKLKQ